MSPTDQKVLDVTLRQPGFQCTEIAALADVEEPTKRKVTSIVSKFYDPLGFLSPVGHQVQDVFQGSL